MFQISCAHAARQRNRDEQGAVIAPCIHTLF